MSAESFLDGRVTLYAGDCRAVVAGLAENSTDAVVTDPPYALVSITRRFGKEGAAPCKAPAGGTGAYARASAGFMGKAWDTGETAFDPDFWAEILRVVKPGGHVVAFGGTRSYHRLACAIEDAGFEIRDQLAWVYGSGFPKSHDVSKGIDKAAGVEREVVGVKRNNKGDTGAKTYSALGEFQQSRFSDVTAPSTDAARQWEGWGTALKPAWEPIVLARKPLVGTVAENVQAHGTGALNIDGCRVKTAENLNGGAYSGQERRREGYSATDAAEGAVPLSRLRRGVGEFEQPLGRWPANLVHDGSAEVLACFPETVSGRLEPHHAPARLKAGDGGDSGSAARFFYTAKADANDRLGSKHPTVKPLDLMQWLVRLVCPPGGTVLDPFAGTGTTGEAAFREGMRAVLIEREAEYQADIRRRMAYALGGPEERARVITKAKGKLEATDGLPLFGGAE